MPALQKEWHTQRDAPRRNRCKDGIYKGKTHAEKAVKKSHGD